MNFNKTKYYLKLVLIISTSFYIHTSFAQTKNATKVFLLAGQSNMDGRARAHNLSTEDKIRLQKIQSNVTLYHNWNPPTPLAPFKAQNHLSRKFEADSLFGPELFFGVELAEKYPDNKFIFIKRAKGGMSLYGAWNPNWDPEKAKTMKEDDDPKLYSDFIKYTHSILDTTTNYELAGMLWVQGETDSGIKKWGEKPALEYEQNLTTLINGVRNEFDPKLPFYIFQVGHGKVVEAMENISLSDKNTFLIPQNKDTNSTDFYIRNPLPLGHYTAKSMKKIGQRFFETYETKHLPK